MDLNRRDFGKMILAAAGGIVAGTAVPASARGKAGEPPPEKASCKGTNECKGKGGCKTDKHECKGKNECKGQGGCKAEHACKGKESCKDKGGCG